MRIKFYFDWCDCMDQNEDEDFSEASGNESAESEEGVQETESTLIVKPKTKSAV